MMNFWQRIVVEKMGRLNPQYARILVFLVVAVLFGLVGGAPDGGGCNGC